MTRINLVPPEELYDQHLVAEFKEIHQWVGSFRRSLRSKNGIVTETIPRRFCLGSGHVKFFYNKLLYIQHRFGYVKREMKRRGFRIRQVVARLHWPKETPPELWQNWEPSVRDMNVVRARIKQKVAMKPDWYRRTA